MVVEVECYAGHRGEEVPRRVRLADGVVEVAGIDDRWLSPDHRYFKVHDARNDVYVLRHDVATDAWELVQFRAAAPSS
jgi:hypothetical protein